MHPIQLQTVLFVDPWDRGLLLPFKAFSEAIAHAIRVVDWNPNPTPKQIATREILTMMGQVWSDRMYDEFEAWVPTGRGS